jgi:HEAT repeat protein
MSNKKTAAELMAELNSDPEFLERVRVQEEAHQKRLADRESEAAAVLQALASAGVEVQTIWELSEGGESCPEAIPVLFEQIRLGYPDHVREAILRALATPHARCRWDELVDIFEHNTANLSPDIRYVAALALSGAADDTVLDDLIRLISNTRLGFDRAPLLLALIRSKSPRAKMALLELRSDPDLGKEIKKMRRLERIKARKPGSENN